MRLLILAPSGYLGGSELSLYETVKALHGLGYQICMVYPFFKPDALVDKIAPYCAEHHIIHYDWWVMHPPGINAIQKLKFAYGYWKSAKAISQLAKNFGAQVIMSSSIVTPVGAMAAGMAGCKHVLYIHELGAEDHNLPYVYGEKLSVKLYNRYTQKVIVNSRQVEQKYGRLFDGGKTHLVYYGVEMTQEPPKEIAQDTPPAMVVMVGRMAPGKRQEDAIIALGMLKKKGIRLNLWLIGTKDDAYGQKLDALIKEWKLEDDVSMMTFTPDPTYYVRKADMAVVCSKKEAFGRVTIEAMKLGIPTVAAAAGGSLEIIDDGRNGLLYEPLNPASLADELEKLYHDGQLRKDIGLAGYHKAWGMCNMQRHGQEIADVLQRA